jgi:Raf kinase inhibitor-like YbhB/YbcL family protein
MRHIALSLGIALVGLSAAAHALPSGPDTPQAPGTTAAGFQPRPGATQPAPPQRRRAVDVMTLASPAWPEGGRIPAKHTQAGGEISPSLEWSGVPDGTVSFVLLVHDLHSGVQSGPDTLLHWLVWNIPGTARSLPEGLPHGDELEDGSRQISATGPYYRGPGAPAAGPAHHYVFELFALDARLDVPAVGQSPAATRAAVMAAMQGHVIGKGAYVGAFRREARSGSR